MTISSNNALMGCASSKQLKFLDGDSSTAIISSTVEKKQRKQKERVPSPIVAADAPPWVTGVHKVLSHKEGSIIIAERERP
ncbi:hypothetical protein C8Q79DRAFT_69852 [Trametes meyenii]|nr:hypothetical protein C8Q79DRAFT_69852 [Trametes meyenii]